MLPPLATAFCAESFASVDKADVAYNTEIVPVPCRRMLFLAVDIKQMRRHIQTYSGPPVHVDFIFQLFMSEKRQTPSKTCYILPIKWMLLTL